jgi:arylsulfatase A-like enzyme
MTSIRLTLFRRAGVLLAAMLAFSANAQFSFTLTNNTPAAIPRRASIILIVADGLGYGDLSCYGQAKYQTPNLDKMAAEGIRFTHYYAGSMAGSPAHAALLLGRDAAHLQQRADAAVPLAADDVTVAKILKQSGYATGLIGEWDLGDENSSGAPWKQGFAGFAGYFNPVDAENSYAEYMWRYVPAPRRLTNSTEPEFKGREMLYYNTGGKKGQYIPDLYTKAAINFIKINQPDQFNRYRPFFLLLNYKLPHIGKGTTVPTDAPFSSEAWPQPEKNRAALIARLDGYIGEVREQLFKLGMTNNVAIFFTSDTIAQKSGGVDPKFFQSNIATNDLRVPMIACWPGKIPAGQTSDFAWTASDFLPTAAEIAYAKPPEKIDGISVLPVLSGQTQTNRHAFLKP